MKISLVEMTEAHFDDWKEIVEQPDLTLEAFKNMLLKITTEQNQDRRYHYMVKDSQEGIVGCIGLFNVWRSEFKMALLDYSMKPSCRRRGFTSEALRMLELKAYSELNLKKLVGYVEMGNLASQGLLRKAGYSFTIDQNGFIDKNGTPRPTHVFVKMLSIA